MTQIIRIATLDLKGFPAHVYYTGKDHRIFIDERAGAPGIQFFEEGGNFPDVLEIDAPEIETPKPCPECGSETTVEQFEIQDQHQCTACKWYLFIRKPEELP